MQPVGLKEVEVAVQDIQWEVFANLIDTRVLRYAEEAYKRLHREVLSESPLLMKEKG